MDAILNNNGIIPQQNTYFAKSKDINYLKNNPVYFDTSTYSLFFRDRQLHQFFVIYNNAHLLKKGRKMNFRNEKNLNVQANVVFQGTTSNKIWNTNYNSKFDLYDRRYYATNTYYYDRDSKTFKECARGTWRFYNYADLIIVDLGTTGYIQDDPKNWTSGIRQPLNHLLTLDMKKTNDTKAKVIKAHYNITFSPSWNSKKVLEKSIYLN